MKHVRAGTPAYLVWVEMRPSFNGKGKTAYYAAIREAAEKVVASPWVRINKIMVGAAYA